MCCHYQLQIVMLLTIALVQPTSATQQCPFDDVTQTITIQDSETLRQVERSTFTTTYDCKDYFGNTTSLRLSGNAIHTVSVDGFSMFYELRRVDLSRNYISNFPKDTFRSLIHLEYIDLSFNNLTSVSAGSIDIYSLMEINLEHNRITYVEPGFINEMHDNLLLVNMKYNKITEFEPWPYLVSKANARKNVDLQHNLITSFTNNMNWTYNTEGARYRVNVDMRYNKLRNLFSPSLQQYFPFASRELSVNMFISLEIDARDNPYYCDCVLYDFTSSFRQSIFRWRDFEDFQYRCVAPARVQGIDWLHDLPYNEFVCNHTDYCPPGCFCQDRPHNDTFFVNCSGAGLSEMPEVLPDTLRSRIEMDLNFNQISEIRNVSYISKLYNLTLVSNTITLHDPEILTNLSILKHLDLRNNLISVLPVEIQRFTYDSVRLAGNTLKCQCDFSWVSNWIIVDKDNGDTSVTCEFDKRHLELATLSIDDLDCNDNSLITVAAVFGAVIVLIVIVFAFAKRCPYESKVIVNKLFKFHPRDKYKIDDDETKSVDIYVTYDDKDSDVVGWMAGYFLKKLSSRKPLYSILNPMRFMEPGTEIERIEKWVGKSKRVVVILSEHFFKNRMRMTEVDIAEENGIQAEVCKNSGIDKCQTDNAEVVTDLTNSRDCFGMETNNAGKIIYIIFNQSDSIKEHLKNDLWKARLAGKTVLDPDHRLFWSKLRYELPSTGHGVGTDGNFAHRHGECSSGRRRRSRTRPKKVKRLTEVFGKKKMHFTEFKHGDNGLLEAPHVNDIATVHI